MTHDAGTCDITTTCEPPPPPEVENATLRAIFGRLLRAGIIASKDGRFGPWRLNFPPITVTKEEHDILLKIREGRDR